nr:MAG TPA: hypothetical protein [Caudoviricetes sp.]
MEPFSCDAKPPRGGGLGELLRQIGKRLFQCAGVDAGGGHGLIGHFPIRAADGFHALGVHVRLDAVRDAVDLGGQLVRHAAQLPQLLDLAVHFVDAHCVYLHFLLARDTEPGALNIYALRQSQSLLSVPAFILRSWFGFRLLRPPCRVPCYGLIINSFVYNVNTYV